MDNYLHWVAKHKRLAFIILSVPVCALYSLGLFFIETYLWLIILTDLLVALLMYLIVATCQNRLMQKAILVLDNYCDPHPLFLETERLLTYKNSEAGRQMILINYCAALSCMGEHQRVFDILSSINIDKKPGTLPIVKLVYYNNLASVCMDLGKNEMADFLHTKVSMIYSDLRNTKQKRMVEASVLCTEAEAACRKQEYLRALQILESIKPNCLRVEVARSMLYAETCLNLGDTERARERLIYVAQYGNKLACAARARNILEHIDE